MDARAAAKQDSDESKQKKQAEVASSTAMGLFAVQQGNTRCGPGGRATSFEDALQADDRAFSASSVGQLAASCAGGRVSPALSTASGGSKASGATASGTSSGRSSPSPTMTGPTPQQSSSPPRTVPPLGGLAAKMASPPPSDLAGVVGATVEEAECFLTKGFTFNEVSRDKAVAMMAQVIDNRMTANRNGLDVESYREQYNVLEEDELPMMDNGDDAVLARLLATYDVGFMEVVRLPGGVHFANSWPEADQPTTAKVAALTRRVAELLILGPEEAPTPGSAGAGDEAPTPGSTGAGGGAAGAGSSMGNPLQASGASANRQKKARRKDNKVTEDGITG